MNAKVKDEPTAAVAQEEIELLKPHTHAGREYPVGAKIKVSTQDADWLRGVGVAKEK